MAKGKGFDPVADAQELSEHNLNPYYWVNKVTSYTYAQWMAERKIAVIALPMYLVSWAAMIWILTNAATTKQSSIWKIIFDFSSSQSLAFLISLLFMFFYTVVIFIMIIQLIFAPRVKPTVPSEHKPEKKKKLPKHRKDYH